MISDIKKNNNSNLKNFLKSNVLLFDGAMGTYYMTKMKENHEKCEMANISNKDVIQIGRASCRERV